jgi:membrane protein involved in colicin uptake
MGVGVSNWLHGKRPVKLKSYHTGGLFTPSGWYFEAEGLHRRFHLKTSQLRKLMTPDADGKVYAYVIIDEHVIEEQIKKYRGEKDRKPQTGKQIVEQQKVDAQKRQEAARKAEEDKRKQAEAERKRQEEAAKKREEYEKQRAIFEQKKQAAEEQRRQLEAAKKAAAEAKKAV